jgi:hypothetical protein
MRQRGGVVGRDLQFEGQLEARQVPRVLAPVAQRARLRGIAPATASAVPQAPAPSTVMFTAPR